MKKKIRDNDQSRNAPRVIVESTKLQNKTKKRKKEEKKGLHEWRYTDFFWNL